MRIIDCDKDVKKKNELSTIYKQLKGMRDKILKHPNYVDDSLDTEEFIKEIDSSVLMKSFLHDINITLSCAFVSHGLLRYSLIFTYKKKKKSKLTKIVRDFLYEAEYLFGFVENIKCICKNDVYYLDFYKTFEGLENNQTGEL